MKRGTKIWLIVALIFGLIGGGLCLSAAILGVTYDEVRVMAEEGDFVWHIGPFRWFSKSHRKSSGYELQNGLDATGQDKVTLLKRADLLNIDMDYGNLTVKASDSSETWLDAGEDAKYFEWEYDGTTLTVQNREEAFDWLNVDNPKATLYIPADSYFEYADIDMDAGSCTIETPIQCGTVEVDVDAGSAHLKDVDTGWLRLDCDAGKITFNGTVADGGEVGVDAGAVEMTLTGAEVTDYNYDIDIDVGSLTINDKNFSGLGHQQFIDNSAPADWSLGCDAGKISMKIKNK